MPCFQITCKKDYKDNKALLLELSQLDPVVKQCIQRIELESDLIAAMKLIAEFELNMLPVQVRLSTNRLQILKDILRVNSYAYQDWEKLLQLATLVRIGTDGSQSEAVLLIAEHALDMDNYSVVANMSKRLVRLNYAPAWACVYKFAFGLGRGLCQQLKIDAETKER